MPFLKRRCPRLESLKIKTLGSLPLSTLKSTLNADVFPDLHHLEFDGIRKTGKKSDDPKDIFPVYKLALDACVALESLTISADSDIVEEVPVLVEMVLERHAKTLKTIRWLGSGGKANERLDLQWFLNTCPNLERVEIINDHGSCSFEKGEVGSVIISDGVFLADENRGSTLIDTSSKSSPLPPSSNLSRTSSRVGPQTPLLLLGSSSSSSSWACASTLTYLEINFRPSPNIRNEYRYKIQIESFYKRLGQLTALVELHVGCECRCHGSQLGTCQHTNCSDVDASNSPALLDMDTNIKADTTLEPTTIFDMSLATGLDHMAGLSKLQVLNISRIQGHNIQEAELEWMKMHWPRLRLLQGVKKQGLVDWLERNWPLQEVVWCNCTLARLRDNWKESNSI